MTLILMARYALVDLYGASRDYFDSPDELVDAVLADPPEDVLFVIAYSRTGDERKSFDLDEFVEAISHLRYRPTHSITSCPEYSRAMCRYAELLQALDAIKE